MKATIISRINRFQASLISDTRNRNARFFAMYLILTIVAIFMTYVNIATQKYTLMMATLLFSIATFIDLLISIRPGIGRQIASVSFSAEITALFTFFIVSGQPEGFSAIWVCMLPASGLLLFGKRRGSALCAVQFVIMIFFFYLPFGRTLLQYNYTDSFMLRFPMLFVAFFGVSFFLETIREETHKALEESREEYQYLSSHDALTNVFNRYGFNEYMDSIFLTPNEKGIALMVLDIDYFKKVNDKYGHPLGDVVLKELANTLVREGGQHSAVCRWGGEEFAVVFKDATDCQLIARRIEDEIHKLSIDVGTDKISITVSIGLVIAPPNTKVDPAILVGQTDRCLYEAKDTGRNRIVQMTYNDKGLLERTY